jgi:hypothetical protein
LNSLQFSSRHGVVLSFRYSISEEDDPPWWNLAEFNKLADDIAIFCEWIWRIRDCAVSLGRGQLSFLIKTTRSKECRIQDVDSVGSGNNLHRCQLCQHLSRHGPTLILSSLPNPSSWFKSFSMVLCTSRSPLLPESNRFVSMASSSSMKIIAGAFSFAKANESRTSLAPSQINICTSEGPASFK